MFADDTGTKAPVPWPEWFPDDRGVVPAQQPGLGSRRARDRRSGDDPVGAGLVDFARTLTESRQAFQAQQAQAQRDSQQQMHQATLQMQMQMQVQMQQFQQAQLQQQMTMMHLFQGQQPMPQPGGAQLVPPQLARGALAAVQLGGAQPVPQRASGAAGATPMPQQQHNVVLAYAAPASPAID
jgi:hypothetical protein